jgi:hypothetical protein
MTRAILLLLALAAAAPAAQTPAAKPITVRDIDGTAHTPLAPAAGGIHVLFFVTVDCPISNRYAQEISRIVSEYASNRVRMFLIYANPALTPAEVRTHRKDFPTTAPVPAIVDAGWAMTSAVGANVTPEAAVYTSAGRVYRGRIDDLNLSLGQVRRAATQRDLRLAIEAVLAGRPVPVAETKAVGCYIERKR